MGILFLVFFAGTAPTMFITLVGIGASPVVAATCALLARRRGLSMRRYAIAGAIYSVLSFLPGVYLIAVLAGRTPPKALIVLAYLAMLVMWVASSIALAMFGMGVGVVFELRPFEAKWVATMLYFGGMIVVSTAVQLTWGWWVVKRRPAPRLDPLPHAGYLVPFGMIQVVILLLLLWDRVGV